MFRNWILTLISFIALMWFGCQTGSKEVASIVGHEGISLNDFKTEFLKNASQAVADTVSMAAKENFLRGMIDERLKLIAGKKARLESCSVVLTETKEARKKALIYGLSQKKILDPVIKESMIRDYYNRSGKEITIRFIFLQYRSQSEADQKKIHAKADSLLREIKAGKSFSALAKVCSDDAPSATKGGHYGPIRYNSINDPLEKKIFSMKEDELSNVIQTPRGDYIVRIEEVKHVKLPPYKEQKEKIVSKLIGQMNRALSERMMIYFSELKEKNHFWFNESLIDSVAKVIQSSQNLDNLNHLFDSKKDAILFTCVLDTQTLGDCQELLNYVDDPRSVTPEQIKEYLERNIRSDLLEATALEEHVDRIPSVQQQIQTAVDAAVKRLIVKQEVYDKIQVSQDSVHAWYLKSQPEKYMTREKVEIQEIQVADKNLAEKLLKRAKSGENFDRLAAKYTIRKGKNKTGGRLSPFSKGGFGAIGDQAFEMKIGEISEIIPSGKNFSIIKKLQVIPAAPVEFDKIKSSATGDYKRHLQQERMRFWLDSLYQSYHVQVNEEALKHAFAL